MPVFFFIDPDFVKDPQMKGIDTVTLSYTFFSRLTATDGPSSPWSLLTSSAEARYDKNGNLKPMPGSPA